MANRLATLACTTSIGPGATNMLTAAAGATINRLPVLLLPGDIFATRRVAPVLQQLESPQSQDVSVNDAFRPVSRYWDRIYRPEQLVDRRCLEAMRVLTSPAETGAVTLALPQDVQAEAFDYPGGALREARVARAAAGAGAGGPARGGRARSDRPKRPLHRGRRRRPLFGRDGGAARAGVGHRASRWARRMAGKGALAYDDPLALGAIGVTGTPGANIMAREADLVIGVGTRYSDFTTASKTAFQDPGVRFVNVNVAEFDAFKHAGLPLVADARVALEALRAALGGLAGRRPPIASGRRSSTASGTQRSSAIYDRGHGPLPSQGEVIGAVNTLRAPAGRRGLRGGQPARRPAQALADARPQGLPPRVRLLLHGLRGGGRAWA